MTESPVIIALDVESADHARQIVRQLGADAGFYKVGMELYAAAGMDFARELLDQGKRVFLDLKFYDIPETVKRAVTQVASAGVDLLTVHAVGQVMRAAVEGRGDSRLKILGVTVLTSLDESGLAEMGHAQSPGELVAMRVEAAKRAKIDGVVCSPLEVQAVRTAAPGLLLVVPGVRSAGAAAGDQKRVATPAQAIQAGANYLVVGRQVTRAENPSAALASIHREIGVS